MLESRLCSGLTCLLQFTSKRNSFPPMVFIRLMKRTQTTLTQIGLKRRDHRDLWSLPKTLQESSQSYLMAQFSLGGGKGVNKPLSQALHSTDWGLVAQNWPV